MVNSFDKWMQEKIVKDYMDGNQNTRLKSFDAIADWWGNNTPYNDLRHNINRAWNRSRKKARLYARYIIGYLEDKQGVAKQSYLTADDAGELMSLIGEYVSSQYCGTGKLYAFIEKLRKVA